MSNFVMVDLEQGSDVWHQWRSGGIGASDAPTIMGENPWKSEQQLLLHRRSPAAAPQTITPAMARGIALEPKARAAYQKSTGIAVQPLCIQSKQREWMRCSLDGICLETMRAVEIKCGEASYKRAARSGRVPDYYYGQLQHTMAVTGLTEMDFFCFLPDRPPVLIKVASDADYIERLITKEAAFWAAISGAKGTG